MLILVLQFEMSERIFPTHEQPEGPQRGNQANRTTKCSAQSQGRMAQKFDSHTRLELEASSVLVLASDAQALSASDPRKPSASANVDTMGPCPELPTPMLAPTQHPASLAYLAGPQTSVRWPAGERPDLSQRGHRHEPVLPQNPGVLLLQGCGSLDSAGRPGFWTRQIQTSCERNLELERERGGRGERERGRGEGERVKH